jgi:hypothetical protein
MKHPGLWILENLVKEYIFLLTLDFLGLELMVSPPFNAAPLERDFLSVLDSQEPRQPRKI